MLKTKREPLALTAKPVSRSGHAIIRSSGSLLIVLVAVVVAPLAAAAGVESLPIDDETELLRRGAANVTVGDLRARALEIPLEDRAPFFAGRQRVDATLRQLLETRQLAEEARRLGLDRSYEFQAAMRIGEERTLAFLYNQHLRNQAIAAADIEQIAQERFLASPPEPNWHVKVRHILIRPYGDRTSAIERAEALRRRVAAGESIEALASRYSDDDGSREAGGLIEGTSDSFAPAFSQAVIQLESEGDVAPLTETEFGFHIIQLISKTQAGQATFENKKHQLMKEAADSVARRRITSVHEKLFGAEIELNEPVVGWLLANPDAFDEVPAPRDE